MHDHILFYDISGTLLNTYMQGLCTNNVLPVFTLTGFHSANATQYVISIQQQVLTFAAHRVHNFYK